MKTIKIIVHHGNYYREEIATGATVAEALNNAKKTPMGIGYLPDPGTPLFSRTVSELETQGNGAAGWCRFELVKLYRFKTTLTRPGLPASEYVDWFHGHTVAHALELYKSETAAHGFPVEFSSYVVAECDPVTLKPI